MLPHCRSSAGLRAWTQAPPTTLHRTSLLWMSHGSSLHYKLLKSLSYLIGTLLHCRCANYLGPGTRLPAGFTWTRSKRFTGIFFNGSVSDGAVGVVKGHLFVIRKRADANDGSPSKSAAFAARDGTMLPRPNPPPESRTRVL